MMKLLLDELNEDEQAIFGGTRKKK